MGHLTRAESFERLLQKYQEDPETLALLVPLAPTPWHQAQARGQSSDALRGVQADDRVYFGSPFYVLRALETEPVIAPSPYGPTPYFHLHQIPGLIQFYRDFMSKQLDAWIPTLFDQTGNLKPGKRPYVFPYYPPDRGDPLTRSYSESPFATTPMAGDLTLRAEMGTNIRVWGWFTAAPNPAAQALDYPVATTRLLSSGELGVLMSSLEPWVQPVNPTPPTETP